MRAAPMVVDLYNAMLQAVDFKKLKGGGANLGIFNINLHLILYYPIVFLNMTDASVVQLAKDVHTLPSRVF